MKSKQPVVLNLAASTTELNRQLKDQAVIAALMDLAGTPQGDSIRARLCASMAELPPIGEPVHASDVLRAAADHIDDRANVRDQESGERSMSRTVQAFNALTLSTLSERDGWLFMVILKAARATNTERGLADDYEDMAAYAALAGESVSGALAGGAE